MYVFRREIRHGGQILKREQYWGKELKALMLITTVQ